MTSVKKSRYTKATQNDLSHSQITARSKYSDLSSKCVSQICTCGLHRCPRVHQIPFTSTTTNQETYKPYKVRKQIEKTPQYRVPQRHYNPEALKTTYELEYVKKKPKRDFYDSNRLNTSKEYTPNKIPFQGTTQYKTKFLKNKIQLQQPYSGRAYTPIKQKFEGQTTYNTEYYRKHANPNQFTDSYSANKLARTQRGLPFDGHTTYNDEYKRFKVRIQNQEPLRSYSPAKIPFKGKTEYQEVFKRYNNLDYKRYECMINQLPPYPNKLPAGQDHVKYSSKKNAWK